MASPSQLQAAKAAPDRLKRTRLLADAMRRYEAAHGACQIHHLRAEGFTESEIYAYADDARAILSGRPGARRRTISQGRKEGIALAATALRIRKRLGLTHE